MIPLLHDFGGETVLVVGGGPVGARKARSFAREARTVVVSPAFADRDFGDAEMVRASPAAEEVADWVDRVSPALVVAATNDDAVNEAAERAAREAGALVNRADRSGGRDAGSVVVPATVRDGSVVAAVATGGAAPALSKELRRRLESEIEGAGPMADLLAEIRADLKAADVPPTDRREAVRAVVGSSAVWKALQEGLSNARQEADRVMEATND
ncbi:precorrin-2 dehydrogenase/sirohydrochlorin ferrochelatase family protein [Halobaculum rubrum]|uniref:precorrin-2 dehydrogenase/sirohydrochlorin ferrochelatase family protein n=1 Tax=Halobaculum rubrum TaxID=2872158 RepID=UPI001CA42FDD|nr:NAD(P)-dependent oxidoreductase [Halobaculum rubrum]QZX98414.1 bifunctional precorrin-2 dehydrogenase/sirohydrochlorin ferrochelatase [Halobaculum rubrum]